MSDLLIGLMGAGAYQFVILLYNELQYVMVCILFCFRLQRRRHFPVRVLLGAMLCGVFIVAGGMVRTRSEGLPARLCVTLLQYTSMLPLMIFCFDEDWTLLVKNWCTQIAVKEIVGAVYPAMQAAFGMDSHATVSLFPFMETLGIQANELIYMAVHFLLYYLLYRLVGGRKPRTYESIDRKRSTCLALATLLILAGLGSISSHYRDESLVLFLCSRGFALSVAVFILLQYAGLEFRSRAQEELKVMEHVMAEERKQYEQMKENIDIINMHCHDLKHQLADFSGRLTDREIAELQEAMEIYDHNIRTGCEALDVVLYLHQLSARQEGITLTCMADGSAVSFMRTRHVYALFNNAIGNAMEAVRQLEDPGMRVISVTVEKAEGRAEIEITNYYSGVLRFTGDNPQTSKADREHHGFGTMSMRYIAEQYGGSMEIEAKQGIYTLHLSIPMAAHLPGAA
ncbi:MAG: sensor histidine kinase [Clostridia bacterium]|nr:sensor histidine kinase [Clostridia bacterium]